MALLSAASSPAGAAGKSSLAAFYSMNGRKTASGELISASQVTAADRSLPLGTFVRVANARKGRSVVVHVKDRGPFIQSRSMDLIPAATRQHHFTVLRPATLELAAARTHGAPSKAMPAISIRTPPVSRQRSAPREASVPLPESAPVLPTVPSACDLHLARVAAFSRLAEIVGPGECGAVDAVLLKSVILPDGSKVAIEPAATLRCSMAEAVAQWIRTGVAPASGKLGAPLRGLEDLASYDCRTRDGLPGAKLSEHGRANALDVRAFELANGQTLVLADPKVSPAWRIAVRASACARFSTVLGPGADPYHSEHVHIDLAQRRNHYKICEWDVRQTTLVAQTDGMVTIRLDMVPLPRPRPLAVNIPHDNKSARSGRFERK